MSSYADYTRASHHYDRTRSAVGLEIVLGCLAGSGAPLAGITVLDAGCGTGNYAHALLSHVGRVEAVDLNEAMLERARGKLSTALAEGRAALHRAPLDALPLADASVHAAIVNQVLHHLPDDPGAGWPRTRAACAELARVVRPGGALVINICSHEQLRDGWWYASLIPAATEAMVARHMPLDALEAVLVECGLVPAGRFVPVDAVMQGAHYFDALGPLDAGWRGGDSVWATVDEASLAAVHRRLSALERDGALGDFVTTGDARRPSVGQLTFVCARKPAV